MPIASRNSAAPPKAGSWLWLMYSTAAASGGATQGPTINADSAPIAATPASEPPRCLSLTLPSFARSAAGSCSSYRPNDDSASATNISANATITHGCPGTPACRLAPTRPRDHAGDGEHQRVRQHVDERQPQRARACPGACRCAGDRPDRIGIIGSTQGMKASTRPPRKNQQQGQPAPEPDRPAARRLSSARSLSVRPVGAASAAAVPVCGSGGSRDACRGHARICRDCRRSHDRRIDGSRLQPRLQSHRIDRAAGSATATVRVIGG